MSAAPGSSSASPRPIETSLALYVHMPWCVRKCPYCDFNSHQLKSAAPDASYIDMLIRDFDAELPRLKDRRIDTVFFGGGTPSLFQPEDFSRLLGALRQRIAFADEVDRLVWHDRMRLVADSIRERVRQDGNPPSDEEIDAIVKDVRAEKSLYERYWTLRRSSAA